MASMRFENPVDPADLYKVREAAKEICGQAGMDRDAAYSFMSAVDEIFSNLMEHSKAAWFEIELSRENGHVRAAFQDNGVAFNPVPAIEKGNQKEIFANATDGQIGLAMISLMVDEVKHSRNGDGINQVILTKKIGVDASKASAPNH